VVCVCRGIIGAGETVCGKGSVRVIYVNGTGNVNYNTTEIIVYIIYFLAAKFGGKRPKTQLAVFSITVTAKVQLEREGVGNGVGICG
jgi:hypothetical protein